jgi:hypothetical protein
MPGPLGADSEMGPGEQPGMGGPDMETGPGEQAPGGLDMGGPHYTGPMALMQQPELSVGGDSLAALAEFSDDPAIHDLLMKQDEERRAMLQAIDQQHAQAAQIILSKIRANGESIDGPGGPTGSFA